MEEEWRPIKGYEGLYEVSNLGRVRSLDHYASNGSSQILYKGVIKKQRQNVGNNYWTVDLCKNNKPKQYLVHRLIAEAFLPNPNNYPVVNHKDEDRTNNTLSNLEWCTYKYNNEYGTAKLRASITRRSVVYQYDTDFNLVCSYFGLSTASAVLRVPKTNISFCLRNPGMRARGFYLSYDDPEHLDRSKFKRVKNRKIEPYEVLFYKRIDEERNCSEDRSD